ncbi:Vi polysaccharide biosynthesis UDP-N-acetylglucosamine C-6 dehydrogenase TviB [Tropicibacter sp. Alg240-R139]|uniref:Vi polysaccharide biosynthesis UDP-N-acetylglucosamine C-6 dehydrogenase TviB n=1 Tax=Tropicibacter sp. Alg240-R139 TaxID=2305991 RepID=UPI0013DE8697|nr:Vi polysaccharide biosynthesis UDP-N-acetylglucosamine C-6 dehydrogenase TviB [Tropicibacter sp. Alg240-R139]
MNFSGAKIAVIGLGYVGLPLAVEFGKKRSIVGFDINQPRIDELRAGEDRTLEVEPEELKAASQLSYTADIEDLRDCTIFIVTVPTPIDANKSPDLTPLRKASETVGQVLKPGDTVIYESTVFPGATEEECVPVLERVSGLTFNADFFAGYSPERINPGDKEHRLPTIKKVTAGSTPEVAEMVNALYAEIVTAGTHMASSIRVAEAAKVIENTQRDLNIALINELAIIFNRMDIDTEAVLEAAGTKWNFLPFRPGLVGGHCIGVDPYYLTSKAESIGYHPEVILAGRRINDGMGAYVASQLVKTMIKRRLHVEGSRVLVLGLTFKENCPDIRNTKVVDVISELKDYGVQVDVHDPWVDAGEAMHEYGLALTQTPETGSYDGIILAVAHEEFKSQGAAGLRALGHENAVLYDVKSVLPAQDVDLRL